MFSHLLAPLPEGEHHPAAEGAPAADSKDTADEKLDGKWGRKRFRSLMPSKTVWDVYLSNTRGQNIVLSRLCMPLLFFSIAVGLYYFISVSCSCLLCLLKGAEIRIKSSSYFLTWLDAPRSQFWLLLTFLFCLLLPSLSPSFSILTSFFPPCVSLPDPCHSDKKAGCRYESPLASVLFGLPCRCSLSGLYICRRCLLLCTVCLLSSHHKTKKPT